MTATPDDERQRAREEANQALEEAKSVVARGRLIASQWRESREANNFRQMLRVLAAQSTPHGG